MKNHMFRICPVEPLLRITGFCSAHENRKPVGYSYAGESHDFWESLFVVQGVATVTAGETIFHLGRGQVIFYPPDEFHRIQNGGDEELRFFVISFSADRFPLDAHRICTYDGTSEVREIVERLRELFVVQDRHFLTELKPDTEWGAVQEVVNRLERLFLGLLSEGQKSEPQRDKNAELYSTAVSLMRQHLSDNLTAPAIAKACGTSISSMQKLFARYTGMGLVRYYTKMRMARARQLLQQGQNVKETAAALGFEDQNYFSTVYRRHFGIPPSKEKEKI